MLPPELQSLAEKIRDTHLREKVIDLMEDPWVEIDGEKFSGLPLDNSPAGLSRHHCYPGGYIEHVVSTFHIATAMCDCVEEVYHGEVSRDLVVAGVLLHDIFKPATYSVNKDGSYNSSRLADYLDHLSLVNAELVRRGFPLELVHIVSAHHGKYAPITPHTVEALICHLADWADSQLNGKVLNAAKYLTRKAVGEELQGLTSREAFQIVHSKRMEGRKGVERTVQEIKKRRTHKT